MRAASYKPLSPQFFSGRGRGRGRIFYGCSRYPGGDFTTPYEPLPVPCPKCGAPFIVEKRTKQGTFRTCIRENCDWEIVAPEPPPAQAPVSPQATQPFVHPQEHGAEPQPVGAGREKS